jgi:hypothetical protein
MIGNQVVSTMFDFDTCNHMVRFILRDDGNEDPGYYHFDLGYDGVFMNFYWHIDPLCMSRGYVRI